MTAKIAVTIDDACEALSISRPTFYKLMKQGRVRTVKIGASTRVSVASLRTLMGDEVPEPANDDGAPGDA